MTDSKVVSKWLVAIWENFFPPPQVHPEEGHHGDWLPHVVLVRGEVHAPHQALPGRRWQRQQQAEEEGGQVAVSSSGELLYLSLSHLISICHVHSWPAKIILFNFSLPWFSWCWPEQLATSRNLPASRCESGCNGLCYHESKIMEYLRADTEEITLVLKCITKLTVENMHKASSIHAFFEHL